MNQRLLLWTAAVAAALMALGLLGLDYPLAHWIHASGWANAAPFDAGLYAMDVVLGLHVWYWLAACVVAAAGLVGIALGSRLPLPPRLAPTLLVAALVQAATIGLMMLGKGTFGRLRPSQLFESGAWEQAWFVGGGSFPSGHCAFYFGLFVPLAAAAPRPWQRAALLAIPAFVFVARLNLEKHFLADVSASALLAALLALLASVLARRWLPSR